MAKVSPAEPGLGTPKQTGKLARLVDPLVLTAAGLAGVADGARIISTKQDVVGGIAAGGWIAGIGALLVAGSILFAAKPAGRAPELDPNGPEMLFRPPATAFALLVLYIVLIEPLGYMLATGLFMAAYLRIFGQYRWLTVLALSGLFAIGSGWLWAMMNMMLPQGPLPWP